MSSSNAVVRVLAALLLAATAAGCGFRPLYGSGESDPGAGADLASVAVVSIPDRIGQELRFHLVELLTPGGAPAEPAYILRVGLSETFSDFAVDSSGIATRANLRVDARFSLIRDKDREIVAAGDSVAVSSYNLVANQYANLAALDDARTRALLQIARQIRLRLGSFFAQRDLAGTDTPR
ncbi:MAG: LPS assembly lipoprotein LptE [Rhodospirillales bacterium]